MNEGEVVYGKNCVLCFSQVIICFASVFVSLGFPPNGSLFLFYFSLHLKVSYAASNCIFFLLNLILKIWDFEFIIHS